MLGTSGTSTSARPQRASRAILLRNQQGLPSTSYRQTPAALTDCRRSAPNAITEARTSDESLLKWRVGPSERANVWGASPITASQAFTCAGRMAQSSKQVAPSVERNRKPAMDLRCLFGKHAPPRTSTWNTRGFDAGHCPRCGTELTRGHSCRWRAIASIDRR